MTTVHIFGMPATASCDQNKTWKGAAEMIGRRLQSRFGTNVRTVYVELYSPESFEFESIVKLLREGAPPPYITINGELIQSGGKLSERRIGEERERMRLKKEAVLSHQS